MKISSKEVVCVQPSRQEGRERALCGLVAPSRVIQSV